jgi:hypothetical protein
MYKANKRYGSWVFGVYSGGVGTVLILVLTKVSLFQHPLQVASQYLSLVWLVTRY